MTTLTPVRRAITSSGVKRRYRSGLEEAIAHQIAAANLPVIYEETTLDYVWPERPSKYTVDFDIAGPNGQVTYIEAKGLFDVQSRHKMLLVKQQHPDLDIRFVFSNANAPIYKGSPTTYAQWCDKHGFPWANRRIPDEWLCTPKQEGEADGNDHPQEPERTNSGSPAEG